MKEGHLDGLMQRWGDMITTWKILCVWMESRKRDTHTDRGMDREGEGGRERWREGEEESARERPCLSV